MTHAGITERGVIQTVRRAAAGAVAGVRVGIGDDSAVLETTAGTALLATTDLLIEDVHFRRRRAEPADIGWKSLAVNLSDVAAMGGRPRWALVALACPAETPAEEVDAFFEGLLALAREHDVAVVGGDTSSSPSRWVVNVTVLGEASHPRLRSTAREGDVIAVTGALGRSAAGLAILERDRAPAGLGADALSDVTSAQLRPVPRVREGRWLGQADGVTAMIDLSDGLATDLGHIAEESGVGALVDLARLPISDSTRRVATALGDDSLAWATGGGEDYELLLTCGTRAFATIAAGLARATGTRLYSIGQIAAAGAGVRFVDDRGRAVAVAGGFQHFGHTPHRRAPRRRARRRAGV